MQKKRKEPKFKYRQVMLLDDNELDNFINEKVIEANHFSEKVYVNSSGKSALEFLSNLLVSGSAASDIYPQAIFIDINMPMMDGFQFIDNLKKIDDKKIKECKLVILTSSIYPEDRAKAKEIGEDITFLNKPLTEAMLNQL
ncbi:MAG: response regulator [Bacteroidia bacterium]